MLVIFDLDDTLIHEGFEEPFKKMICAETMDVLKHLKERNHTLAVASHNLNAENLVKLYGMHEYFHMIVGECPPCYTKMPLINAIMKQTGKCITDVIYFDDLIEMTSDTARHNVKTKLVNYLTGITMKDIIEMGL